MRLLTFTLFILLSISSRSQKIERQVITGSGADLVKPGCRISCTIGELAVTTTSGTQVLLTQGFQQPVSMPVNGPLPARLLYFTGALRDGKTQLEWKTAQEWNVANYHIERSANGIDYTLLSMQASKGNSDRPVVYQGLDPAPYSPFTYYRLKIVDIDQQFVYSQVVMIKKQLATGFSLFPNPATDYITVSVNLAQKTTDTWQLTAMNGRQVATRPVVLQPGLNTIQWNINNLPQGTYLIHSAHAIFPVLKFIKQ